MHWVLVRNSAARSGNPLHDRVQAITLGYPDAIISGADTFAYLCAPAVERWGSRWFECGVLECRLLKPIFDGQVAHYTVTEARNDVFEIELTVDGEVRATARCALLPGVSAPAVDAIPAMAMSARPERLTAAAVPIGTVLPTIHDLWDHGKQPPCVTDAIQYPVYQAWQVLHPYHVITLAIRALADNFVPDVLIHVASRLQNYRPIHREARIEARSRVLANYETRGHQAVHLDVNIIANGAVAATVRHRHDLSAASRAMTANPPRQTGKSIMFKAIHLTQSEDKVTTARVANLDDADLPQGEVLIRVAYSTLNYKDALAITGAGPVVRLWPMIPGIDLAGVVEHSAVASFKPGDAVIANGWGLGETRWGGLGQKAAVPANMLTNLPDGFSARDAMAIGTAGYTAMLCVQALEAAGVSPEDGDILVTGANGGVGSVAIAILASKGFRVAASTGRLEEAARLEQLGAAVIVDREDFAHPGRPLQKERWAAAIDCVGGQTLANVCAGIRYGGVVTACGLAGGMDFPASVAPFILRGVTLIGIDSVMASHARRDAAWAELTRCIDRDHLPLMADEISLEQAIAAAADLIAGRIRGRLIIDTNR